jgi:DNA-directed RNA polymerase subunit RPC12/RpoP
VLAKGRGRKYAWGRIAGVRAIDDVLRACAEDYQAVLVKQQPGIEKRIKQLEAELTQQRAALLAARWAEALLKSYTPTINGQNRCPYCWVGRSVISPLQAEEYSGDEDAHLACPACEREISIAPRSSSSERHSPDQRATHRIAVRDTTIWRGRFHDLLAT